MKTNAQLDDLSTKVGDLIHNWGFKRIHGRIWTRLFLSNRPLDAADLIEQLDISKALVSISLRELLEVRAVEEVGRSSRGTNLFKANQDLNTIYLETLKVRERKMLEQTAAALTSLANLEAGELNATEVSQAQMSKLATHLQNAMKLLNEVVGADENVTMSNTVKNFPSANSPTNSPSNNASGNSSSSNSPQGQGSHFTSSSSTSMDSQTAMVLPARAGY